MSKINLKDYIVPARLYNTDNNGNYGDGRFDTIDLIFLEAAEIRTYDGVRMYNGPVEQHKTSPTDYALVNGALQSWPDYKTDKKGQAITWLRSADFFGVKVFDPNGYCNFKDVDTRNVSLRPVLHINLSSVISARSASRDLFKIGTVKNDNGDELYHTIEFGEYPKTYVGEKLNAELEKAYMCLDAGYIKPTGKKYTGHINNDNKVIYHNEYEYRGQKYVRVKVKSNADKNFYSDGTKILDRKWAWIKVEPIVWEIRNWDSLPEEINPNGDGSAEYMEEYIEVRTEEAIACLPFYPNLEDENTLFWQNSLVRGYLNGINVNNISTNGNLDYTAPNGGNFLHQNFLTEALDLSMVYSLTKQINDEFSI